MIPDATDADLTRILTSTRTIALVGFSQNAERPSHGVAKFLQRQGYRVIPVNPGLAGQVHLGETVRASLSDIAEPIDMVDIFRRAEDVPPVVADALASHPEVRTVWMQLGIVNEAAAAEARARGIEVVMNRCPAIEIPRLGIAPVG
jgi:predicted CoA-binding protein